MSKPLEIVITNNVYPPIMAGGAELIVAYLAEGLAKRGHHVRVVSTCSPEMEPYPTEMQNGVEVIRFFPKNFYWHWDRKEKNHPKYKKALWHVRDAWNIDTASKFKKILNERKADIVHSHLLDGMSATLWREGQKAGAKTVHTAHDYHLMCPRSVMLDKNMHICSNPSAGCRAFRTWHLNTTRYVDLFCSPSSFLIEKHKEAGIKSGRSAVVRNGIPLPDISEKNRPADHKPTFLFAARHTVEKGVRVLIDAAKKMPADIDYNLWIAGKGPLEDEFKALAESDSRVKLLGFISGDEKTEIFKQADCLMIPSLWYENAPVVIVEAAAFGIGIIGSDIGAIPEFVEHESNGLLFEMGNADALAQSMMRVISEPDLLDTFAKGGRALLSVSSVDTMVDGYLEQYEKLLHAQRAA